MCAAVYIFGNYGNGTCPENAVQIGSEDACERAAIFMGLFTPDGNNGAYYPQYDQLSGCSADKSGFSQFFDRDPTFAARLNPAVRPLCAVGTCLPRIHARRAVRHGTNNVHAACPGTTEHPQPRPYSARPARLHDAAPTRPFSCTRRAAQDHAPLGGILRHCQNR
jgi:hypothetical protein